MGTTLLTTLRNAGIWIPRQRTSLILIQYNVLIQQQLGLALVQYISLVLLSFACHEYTLLLKSIFAS